MLIAENFIYTYLSVVSAVVVVASVLESLTKQNTIPMAAPARVMRTWKGIVLTKIPSANTKTIPAVKKSELRCTFTSFYKDNKTFMRFIVTIDPLNFCSASLNGSKIFAYLHGPWLDGTMHVCDNAPLFHAECVHGAGARFHAHDVGLDGARQHFRLGFDPDIRVAFRPDPGAPAVAIASQSRKHRDHF